METTYYLDEMRRQTMTGSKLKAYANLHHDELLEVSMKDSDIIGLVVANYRGYVTIVTENGNIVQGWAGEFVVC